MKLTIEFIKKIISITSLSIILLSFIISVLITNPKNSNYIEFTDLSKFFLNLYIFILLSLLLTHIIYPQIICSFIKENFGIILNDNGRLIILSSIFILYFGTGNMPQKIFGMISFVATFGLFLCKIILKNKAHNKNELSEETKI